MEHGSHGGHAPQSHGTAGGHAKPAGHGGHKAAPPAFLKNFAGFAARIWIAQFLAALYACIVAHKVFGIALEAVINVQLALQIALPFALILLYVAISLVSRNVSNIAGFAAAILAYLLTPFAAMVGYMLYGSVVHVSPARSFVYAGVMRHVHDTLIAAAELGARLSIPHVGYLATPHFFGRANIVLAAIGLLLAAMMWAANRRAPAAAH
ncbi:MAG TPA: hypothetical protein VGC36_07925 [Rhizomicrobium sp.]